MLTNRSGRTRFSTAVPPTRASWAVAALAYVSHLCWEDQGARLANCIPVLGKTSERIRDPSMATYETLNTDCLVMCGIMYFTGCGWMCVAPSLINAHPFPPVQLITDINCSQLRNAQAKRDPRSLRHRRRRHGRLLHHVLVCLLRAHPAGQGGSEASCLGPHCTGLPVEQGGHADADAPASAAVHWQAVGICRGRSTGGISFCECSLGVRSSAFLYELD
jgi:hypothetical protein